MAIFGIYVRFLGCRDYDSVFGCLWGVPIHQVDA